MNYIDYVDSETFFIVISVCAVLCTIAVVFGKDKAQKSIIYPVYILLIILTIICVIFLGYQIIIFGADVIQKMPMAFWATAIIVLANVLSQNTKSDKDKKDK